MQDRDVLALLRSIVTVINAGRKASKCMRICRYNEVLEHTLYYNSVKGEMQPCAYKGDVLH
jgi:hypothetical protein